MGQSSDSSDNGRPSNWLTRFFRRVHMYLALLMFPWILLYGITGFLLNHPRAFPDHEIRRLDAETFKGTSLNNLPEAEQVARNVLEGLTSKEEISVSEYQISPGSAKYHHEAIFDITHEGKEYQLIIHPIEQSGWLHIRPVQPERETPLGPIGTVDLADSTRASLATGAIDILKRLDIATDRVHMGWGPQVEFEMTDGEKAWIVNYNIGNRNIDARPLGGWPGPRSWRQYLIRLHSSHTYPEELGRRMLWAMTVDFMSIGLILWGLTGVLMWLQRRSIRLSGAILILISAIWASGLGYLMYQVFRHQL